ncbi:LysR family transcriptional regulator, partial [Pseudomonas sp. Pseusp122]
GEGLAYKSWLDVAADVQAGHLKILLPQLQGERSPLNILCAHRAQLSQPVNALRDLLRIRCEVLARDYPGQVHKES